jgi:cob(I)alamin adenosyltransferase
MNIYTRTGDSGETGLLGPQRVPKDDPRVQLLGEVDELNAFLGCAVSSASDSEIAEVVAAVQSTLFALGAEIAAIGSDRANSVPKITQKQVQELEQAIDRYNSQLPPLRRFILPGGTACAAVLHIARAVCRRAERTAVALSRSYEINAFVLPYLNRLSDLLFVLARLANAKAGAADREWKP